ALPSSSTMRLAKRSCSPEIRAIVEHASKYPLTSVSHGPVTLTLLRASSELVRKPTEATIAAECSLNTAALLCVERKSSKTARLVRSERDAARRQRASYSSVSCPSPCWKAFTISWASRVSYRTFCHRTNPMSAKLATTAAVARSHSRRRPDCSCAVLLTPIKSSSFVFRSLFLRAASPIPHLRPCRAGALRRYWWTRCPESNARPKGRL